MKRFLLLFAMFFLTQKVDSVNKLPTKFFNELKKLYGRELPSCFFVIQGNTGVEMFTNAPAIIKRVKEIRTNQLCPHVIFIWRDGAGVGSIHLVKFMKTNFNVDTSRFVSALISEKLYDLLGDVPNSEVYYIRDNKIHKKWDGKYDRITDELPYAFIKVKETEVAQWTNANGLYHTNTSLYSAIDDSLAVELFDGQEDRIRLTNILTGRVKKIMPLYNTIDYLQIYEKTLGDPFRISASSIKRYDKQFKDIKRTPFRVSRALIKGYNDIYIVGDVDIYHRNKSRFYVPGEYKTKTYTIEPGALTNSTYACILKTDTSFAVKDTLLFPNFKEISEFNRNHFLTWDDATYIKNNEVYMSGYPYNQYEDKTYDDLYRRNEHAPFIYKFEKQGVNLQFHATGNAKSKQPFSLYYRNEDFEIFGTNKNTYGLNALFPEIYSFEREQPVQAIVDTSGLKSRYQLVKDYDPESKKENIPYYLYCMSPDQSDRLMMGLYRLNNNFYLFCMDTKLRVLDRKDITNLVKHRKEILNYEVIPFFSKNHLNFVHCKDGTCTNTRIEIDLSAVNISADRDGEYFVR